MALHAVQKHILNSWSQLPFTTSCEMVVAVSVFQRRQLFFFTFPPQLQLPKSCDGVTEGHPLTVRLMRSEMPWVGLAARTMVTVAGCVPWFLGEGNRNMNSSVQRFWLGRTWLGLQICVSDIFLKWFWSSHPVIFPCTGSLECWAWC